VIYALISQIGQVDPPAVYVAVSKDGAASWTTATEPAFTAYNPRITLDPGDVGTLYVGTLNGVLKTADGGGHWNLANSGLRATEVLEVVVDSQTTGTLCAVNTQGVFKSTDRGNSWFSSSSGLAQDFGNLVTDPQNPRTLYITGSLCNSQNCSSTSPLASGCSRVRMPEEVGSKSIAPPQTRT
jgi:photosystem II stability/assembly factor-like uncharacterized protein